MSTDTDIWERACERAGVWKRNEKRFRYNRYFATENEYTVSAPPLGDPAAAMKMLEWVLAHENFAEWDRLYGRAQVSGLALGVARTVLAIPEEHQS